MADECIDQAVVYGEGRNFLTALHRAALGQPAQGARASPERDDELARSPAVNEFLRKRVSQLLADVAG